MSDGSGVDEDGVSDGRADRPANFGEKTAFCMLTGQASQPSYPRQSGRAGRPRQKRSKLSSVVDVTAEAELIPLSPEVVCDMFEKYISERGEPPAPDIEPTGEQLGAVK